VGSPTPAIESTSLERRMTKASADTIAINDHEAAQVQRANPTTGAN
jgi:hypothetical protein